MEHPGPVYGGWSWSPECREVRDHFVQDWGTRAWRSELAFLNESASAALSAEQAHGRGPPPWEPRVPGFLQSIQRMSRGVSGAQRAGKLLRDEADRLTSTPIWRPSHALFLPPVKFSP